jgi:hypothetical protein
VQEERVVGHDNTVRYQRPEPADPTEPAAAAVRQARVRVHDDPDGTLAIFHGPRCLARYRADGAPLDHHQPLAA